MSRWRRFWLGYRTPVAIVVIGIIVLVFIAYVVGEIRTAWSIFYIFVGAALAMITSDQLVRVQAREGDRRILDSLRRSVERVLASPSPVRMPGIIQSGVLPGISIRTPIVLVHLSESMVIVASDPRNEELYTWLIELNKAIRHLNQLQWLEPLLRASIWGVAGVDIVKLESGQISSMELDPAVWRQYRIALGFQRDCDKFLRTIWSICAKVKPLIESALKPYGQDQFPAPSLGDTMDEPEDPYADLWPVLDGPMTPEARSRLAQLLSKDQHPSISQGSPGVPPIY